MPSKTKGQRESVLEVCKLCKYESKCICRVSVGWEHPLELVAAFGVGSLSSMNSHFPSTLDNIFANHHLVTSHPSEPSPVGPPLSPERMVCSCFENTHRIVG